MGQGSVFIFYIFYTFYNPKHEILPGKNGQDF